VALLPDAERALIATEKLRDYLLSPTHAVGRFKAAFFAKLVTHKTTGNAWQTVSVDRGAARLITLFPGDP
jgi:hypothetical protein